MMPTSVFTEELQQFHMLRDIGQHLAIDAGWLAHLASLLWSVPILPFAAGIADCHVSTNPSCHEGFRFS